MESQVLLKVFFFAYVWTELIPKTLSLCNALNAAIVWT